MNKNKQNYGYQVLLKQMTTKILLFYYSIKL